jgi:hypothetical protein
MKGNLFYKTLVLAARGFFWASLILSILFGVTILVWGFVDLTPLKQKINMGEVAMSLFWETAASFFAGLFFAYTAKIWEE